MPGCTPNASGEFADEKGFANNEIILFTYWVVFKSIDSEIKFIAPEMGTKATDSSVFHC